MWTFPKCVIKLGVKVLKNLKISSSKSAFRIERSDGYYNQKGQAYINCPFHREKTPSLWVTLENNFHCFGCGKSGTHRQLGSAIKNPPRLNYIPYISPINSDEMLDNEDIPF
jgi:hypothetical protein